MSGPVVGIDLGLLGEGKGVDQRDIAALEIPDVAGNKDGPMDLAGGRNLGIRELNRSPERWSARNERSACRGNSAIDREDPRGEVDYGTP